MKESNFIRDVIFSIKSQGKWAYKIPDMPSSYMIKGRFNPEKPCDIISFLGMVSALIECKQQKKYEAFGIRHLRESQIEALDEIVDLEIGQSYVFLNVRVPRKINKLIIFDWKETRERFKSGISYKKKEIEEMDAIDGKKGCYDLSSFIAGANSRWIMKNKMKD